MKQVYVANNPTEAHIVSGRLEAAGIRAFVQGENLYAIRGGVGMIDVMPTVRVDDPDSDRARRLLEETQGWGDASPRRVNEGTYGGMD